MLKSLFLQRKGIKLDPSAFNFYKWLLYILNVFLNIIYKTCFQFEKLWDNLVSALIAYLWNYFWFTTIKNFKWNNYLACIIFLITFLIFVLKYDFNIVLNKIDNNYINLHMPYFEIAFGNDCQKITYLTLWEFNRCFQYWEKQSKNNTLCNERHF